MIRKKRCWLTLVLLVATFNLIHIHANENGSSDNKQPIDDNTSSLENLTNEELEAICTSRGFELVRELDEHGKERTFTRENYMDAARQCLDVEAEM